MPNSAKKGLAEKVLEGDVQAASRLISQIEDGEAGAFDVMDRLYPHTGRAYIVGVTGAPGVGKSTLIDNLIGFFREKGMSVGVIAVDPTSALTGGALLGDRVRLQRHSTDPGVFIRSLATRGWRGGLARSALGAIHVMDALGRDIILVETVGSGQVEIDIVRAADTALIVLAPGAGDEIQMMKAGILEAVDLFVINKADTEGAEGLKTALEAMLGRRPDGWMPGIVLTEAINDKGTEALAKEILRHREFLNSGGEISKRWRERAKLEILEASEAFVRDFVHRIDKGNYLEKLVDDLLEGKTTPHRAGREMASLFAEELGKSRRKQP
jgi:LAO/AO transport system kinase